MSSSSNKVIKDFRNILRHLKALPSFKNKDSTLRLEISKKVKLSLILSITYKNYYTIFMNDYLINFGYY